MWKKKCNSFNLFKKKFIKKIVNIHIQDPKVSLDNFNFIIAPEHDGLTGNNVYQQKGPYIILQKMKLIIIQIILKNKLDK